MMGNISPVKKEPYLLILSLVNIQANKCSNFKGVELCVRGATPRLILPCFIREEKENLL